MKRIFQKWFPPLLMFVMAVWFFGGLQPPKDKDFAFNEFAKLPVVFDGRLKPMDSLARNSLLQIRETQTLNLEPWEAWNENPKIISATEWLANVMMNPAVADGWPVFRVDNPDLTSQLKLPERNPAEHQDGEHFSWNQIAPMLDTLDKANDQAQQIDDASRTAYQRAVVKLHDQMALYAALRNTVQPADTQDWPAELADYENLIPAGVAAVKAQQAGQPYNQTNFDTFVAFAQEFQFMSSLNPPLVLPPNGSGDWRRMGDALLDAPRGVPIDNYTRDYAKMAGALANQNAADFNAALADYRASLVPKFSNALAWARAEVFFNQAQPFYHALVIYVLAGLLAIFFWFNLSETLRRASVWLLGLALVIHTTGLIYRMVLEGRPPVTNLYSSAIFIGWVTCLLGLILEKFYRNGIGAVVSAGIGFITLVIAQNLAVDGDTMEMMRAVLDTNFWLATHVVAVTVGYASTFVAGFLGLIYIVLGVFTNRLNTVFAGTGKSVPLPDNFGKTIARMIYGIVCFATLFSFVGTVLGGIWADQSWGRFWGWDPKENGALIIVLWNALILHLRWGGMIRDRGMAVCAIGGNIVTSWSWFGVNMLGIGLHSYGFTDAAFKWLSLFVISQLGLIALGLMPPRMWKSFAARA
ncbi:MAG TPA: cytochrome c biogenesis protein CcsA [Verrucomicrobiae bacterium]|nr:cytochrome c biogenesis protein CcsA [Verrucomicrobiae bacterium]